MKAVSILALLLLIAVASAQYAGYYEFADKTSCNSSIHLNNVRAYLTDQCMKPNQDTKYMQTTGYSMFTCNTTHVILTHYADADTSCELALATTAFPRNSCDQEVKWDCFSSFPDPTQADSEWQVSLEVTYYKSASCDQNQLLEWSATGYQACNGKVKTFCDGQNIVSEMCDEGCESGCKMVDAMPELQSKCTSSSEENWDLHVEEGYEAQSAYPVCKGVQGVPATSAAEVKTPSAWILVVLILAVLF